MNMITDDRLIETIRTALQNCPGASLSIVVTRKHILEGCFRGLTGEIAIMNNAASHSEERYWIGGVPVVVEEGKYPVHVAARFEVTIDGQVIDHTERLPIEQELTLEEVLALEGIAHPSL